MIEDVARLVNTIYTSDENRVDKAMRSRRDGNLMNASQFFRERSEKESRK